MRTKISEDARALCYEIEKLPASEQQTACSLKACDLYARVKVMENICSDALAVITHSVNASKAMETTQELRWILNETR
jgi:hypothetical protein